MEAEDTQQGIRSRADLLTAIVLVALGIAVVYLSWIMPRLEARRISPGTFPGLVPLLLGVALTVCGSLLGFKAARDRQPGGWSGLLGLLGTRAALRIGAIMALALFYTLVLVGWLPFWAASMIFIFAFIMLFEVYLTDSPAPLLRTAVWAAVIAVVAGGGIYLAFARIFLVRLP